MENTPTPPAFMWLEQNKSTECTWHPKATEHAYSRAKERLGWNKKTLDRMMLKALMEGVGHKNTTGKLHRYITRMWFKNKACNNIKIYGEVIYLFVDYRLLTLYHLQNSLRKGLKNIK